VASDLSAPLLKSLKDFYDQQYAGKGDCTIVQLNAEDLVFEQDQFDLVVGGAILHHLFDPTLTLTQCYKVLKPGGCAIFFEPFEIGYQLLAIAIKHVLQRNPDRPSDARLSEDVERFFTALVKDIDVRKGSDKSAEIFQRIDDKWLFTQQFFESAARAIGFAGTEIYPIHGSESQFSNQMKSFMQLGLHSDINVAPAWAIETFVEMDGQFSRDLLPELIIEGCIILKK
jgi:ubiquinone/menaquinone biosynthesis C-methylase UbiE